MKTWFSVIPDSIADLDIHADSTARYAKKDAQNGSNTYSNKGSVRAAYFKNSYADKSLSKRVSTADFNNDSADTLPSEGVSFDILPFQGVSQPTLPIAPPMDQDETDTLRFDEDLHMPPMIGLASSGLRQYKRLVGKNPEKHSAI